MAVEGNKESIPGLVASADLSAKQFRFVKVSGDFSVNVCGATTDCPVGVLDNNPKSGEEATVTFKGIQKVKASGAITAGARVGTDATGLAIAEVEGTDTTKYIVGVALNAAANANDIISVLLSGTPHRAG